MEVDPGELISSGIMARSQMTYYQTAAYNFWKTRFDAALTSAPTAIGAQLLRNSIPIYAVAHCTLAVDVDELQIFAGAQQALGLSVVSGQR